MTSSSPEDRRERANRHNVAHLETKPALFGDQLRELGLTAGAILLLVSLVFLTDGLLTAALAVAGLAVTLLGASVFLTGTEGERRWLHLVNAEDETLRFDLRIRDEHGGPIAEHSYELPAGERAVFDDTFGTDAPYTIAVSPDGAPTMRTSVTPVRSAVPDDDEALVVEIDRSGVRTGPGTDAPTDPTEGTPHELWLAE